MMLLSRVFLIEFGVFTTGLTLMMAWQVGRAWRGRRLFVDEWLLAAGAVTTGAMYVGELVSVRGGAMPRVSGLWVVGFGACCVVHLGMRAVRVLIRKGAIDGRRSA